jgi:chlorophyll/bacteriochlorophyll a synthase
MMHYTAYEPSFNCRAVAELLKPITWFPADVGLRLWRRGLGAVALQEQWLADRHRAWRLAARWCVPPARPPTTGTTAMSMRSMNRTDRFPSGRIPGRWGLYIAIFWTDAVAAGGNPARSLGLLGAAVAGLAARLGLQRAAAAPEAQRLVGQCRLRHLSYEGLAWVTGAAVMAGGAMPELRARWLLAASSTASVRARHHDA